MLLFYFFSLYNKVLTWLILYVHFVYQLKLYNVDKNGILKKTNQQPYCLIRRHIILKSHVYSATRI